VSTYTTSFQRVAPNTANLQIFNGAVPSIAVTMMHIKHAPILIVATQSTSGSEISKASCSVVRCAVQVVRQLQTRMAFYTLRRVFALPRTEGQTRPGIFQAASLSREFLPTRFTAQIGTLLTVMPPAQRRTSRALGELILRNVKQIAAHCAGLWP
jgi:hypothetical protein